MSRTAIQIGPADHGKHMSLEEFDHAEGEEGHLYELSKGVITVMDVPDRRHFAQFNAVRRQLNAYDLSHPGEVDSIGGGGECKVLLPSDQSERHPDVAVYLCPCPAEDTWATWVPGIAIEIVSRGSRHRDYVEKREEYLKFGVREYWIIDADKEQMLALRRVGKRWVEKIVAADGTYRTRLLPEFELDMKPIFDAARASKEFPNK